MLNTRTLTESSYRNALDTELDLHIDNVARCLGCEFRV